MIRTNVKTSGTLVALYVARVCRVLGRRLRDSRDMWTRMDARTN